jgi:GTPase SAR1 family protein
MFQEEKCRLEDHIKWAEAYILMYSVTDRCSFSEVSRLKFLINSYSKKQRKSVTSPEAVMTSTPVVLVANQIDRIHDRMVTQDEGFQRSLELGCLSFHEISVRENVESVSNIFEDIYLMCRKPRRCRQQLCKQLSLPAFMNEEKPEETFDSSSSLNRRRKAIFTVS